jgi:hypothetical protein
MIKIDQKMTVWARFEIEDEHEEALKAYLEENPLANYDDLYNWACEMGEDPVSEYLEGTEEELTPDDNGGQSTLEINLDNKLIFEK